MLGAASTMGRGSLFLGHPWSLNYSWDDELEKNNWRVTEWNYLLLGQGPFENNIVTQNEDADVCDLVHFGCTLLMLVLVI